MPGEEDIDTYVSKTLELLELERQAEIDEKRHVQESISHKELERRGVCVLKLRVGSQHSGLYGRQVVVFEPFWADKGLPAHNITPGDIAGLSESSAETGESLGSGIVSHVTPTSISVAFDENHDTLSLDDRTPYKLLKLANDVTYRRIKRALEELRKYRGGRSGNLVDVLFGSDPGPSLVPERDGPDTAYLNELKFYNEKLDESQQAAVKFALCQRELAIIHGPPGTGKTTTVVEIIRQAVTMNMKVLVCAPSNIAVDNLVERLAVGGAKLVRLGHPARLLASIQHYSLDAVIARSQESEVTNSIREDLNKAMGRLKKTNDKGERQKLKYEMRLLQKDLRQQEMSAVSRVLKACQVVLATLTTATEDGPIKHLQEEHFDVVVIDECSQALEAACWQVLLRAPRCVLAGDHKQLPPTILSHQAAKEGLERTLMERLIELHGDAVVRMLTTQYRMHHLIMDWASQQLYGGQLKAHPSVAEHTLKDLPGIETCEETSMPLLLIDTAGCDLYELDLPDEVSKGNEGEVELVVAHVEKLIRSGLSAEDIAVIAPYNLQVELLRLKLSLQHPNLEIKSVDGFQGREKEAVVISMVRSNEKGEVGFLAEDRRINVAITRARRHLVVVCDSETVGHHKFLKGLVDYMMEHGEVHSAQQYIQDGTIQVDSKRPESLESKLSEMSKKDKTKQKAGKQGKKKPQDRGKPAENASQKQSARSIAPKISEKDELEKIEETLKEFSLSSKKQHAFPATLTSWQRMKVHEVSERLGLLHLSQGEGTERFIMVSKPDKSSGKTSKSYPTEVQQSASNVDAEGKDYKCKKTKNNVQHTESLDKVKEKVSEKSELASQKEIKLDKMGSKPDQTDENGAEAETDAADVLSTCSKCSKQIPGSNMQLHELRCQGPPGAGAKPKKNKNKKKAEVKRPEDDEDFDALLAAAVKENTTCYFAKCKALTATLGMNCEFCARRFCLSHHIPEVHGCGDAARSKARHVTIRAGVVYRGSGVPDKKPDPIKRAHLERKLEKKLNEETDKRSRKQKDDKK